MLLGQFWTLLLRALIASKSYRAVSCHARTRNALIVPCWKKSKPGTEGLEDKMPRVCVHVCLCVEWYQGAPDT